MGSGQACVCKTKDKRNWVVRHYKHNHSAFQTPKYGAHSSDYSMVQCKKCLRIWSTKATYVEGLALEEFD